MVIVTEKEDGTKYLSFIRGDSCPLKFQIFDVENNPIAKEDLNSLYLTCRKSNTKYSEILFQKKINDFGYENNFYFINIEPQDTRELPYDTYNFDIEATFRDGEVQTLKSKFVITDEDTIYEEG